MFLDTGDLKNKEIYFLLYKTADENFEKMYLPAYYFKIMRSDDDTELGKCDLRIGHNENTKYGGNIGYEIYESFRGNRYASEACKLLFKLAKKHKMKKLIITCAPENIASRRTCEYSGGEFIGIIDVPDWHQLYKDGQKQTCRYVIDLRKD